MAQTIKILTMDNLATHPSRYSDFEKWFADLSMRVLTCARAPFEEQGSRLVSVGKRIDEIAEMVIGPINALFNATPDIVTVRAIHGSKKSFLRPLYSMPKEVHKYFTMPEHYIGFDFSESSFEDATLTSPGKNGDLIKIALYELAKVGRHLTSENHKSFGPRISKFLDEMEDEKYLGRDLREAKDSYCLVAGRLERRSPSTTQSGPFQDFLAVYFRIQNGDPKKILSESESSTKLSELCKLIFDAMEAIEDQDRNEFKNEGLRLVSRLLPIFMDTGQSPARKIRSLLDGLEQLLDRHLLGVPKEPSEIRLNETGNRPLNEGKNENIAVKAFPRVNFIDIHFTKPAPRGENNAETAIIPEFSVYPRSTAYSYSTNAFLLSHPRNPTIVKWLLNRYCEKNKCILDSAFSRLFDSFNVRFDREVFSENCDRIVFSSDTGGELSKIWANLNQDLDPAERPSRSLAAFIVKAIHQKRVTGTERDVWREPCGILLFESELPDAFSTSDISFLTSFVEACEPLIQSVRSSHSVIDFRNAIRRAYVQRTSRKIGKGESRRSLGDFVFELERLDGHLFEKIVGSDHPKVTALTGLDVQERQRLLGKPLSGIGAPDEKQDKKAWERSLTKRIKWILKNENRLSELWKAENVEQIYDFLRHIPSNAVWHSYLNSIPRAIGDRPFEEAPIFNFLTPGYSAMTMFMLSTSGEIRQIVKLSKQKKIERERDRYRKYVRYKVPLAARLPITAFAFETSGYSRTDVNHDEEDGFGALISDLVGGSPNESSGANTFPFSFLDQCVFVIGLGKKQLEKTLLDAIGYHFNNNTTLWKGLPDDRPWHRDKEDTATAIRYISRVDSEGDDIYPDEASTKLENSIKRISRVDHSGAFLKLLKLLSQWHTDVIASGNKQEFNVSIDSAAAFSKSIRGILYPGIDRLSLPDLRQIDESHRAIIHGDLNGRNLTWSVYYEKLFLIDFEYVDVGFWGADQLKLVASLISELLESVPNSFGKSPPEKVEKNVHANIINGISYVHTLSTALSDPWVDLPPKTSVYRENRLVVELINRIVGSIRIDVGGQKRNFWKYALICYMYKQFEHSLAEIDKSCLDAIGKMKFSDSRKTERNFPSYIIDSVATGIGVEEVKPRIAKLVYTFCGLLAAIPSKGAQGQTRANSRRRRRGPTNS